VRELPADEPLAARLRVRRAAVALLLRRGERLADLLEKLTPLRDGDQKERMVADLDEELRVDLVIGQVRVGRRGGPGLGALPEAERSAHHLPRREHPVEAVERALVERRVVL